MPSCMLLPVILCHMHKLYVFFNEMFRVQLFYFVIRSEYTDERYSNKRFISLVSVFILTWIYPYFLIAKPVTRTIHTLTVRSLRSLLTIFFIWIDDFVDIYCLFNVYFCLNKIHRSSDFLYFFFLCGFDELNYNQKSSNFNYIWKEPINIFFL